MKWNIYFIVLVLSVAGMVIGCLMAGCATVSIPPETRAAATAGSYPIVATSSYQDTGDGTINDLVTGLMWTKSPDLSGDGKIDIADQRTLAQAFKGATSVTTGGYSDWRLPTIKELYSLIDFQQGRDGPPDGPDASSFRPFIDTRYFDFGYGDVKAGQRIIDAHAATSTLYVDKTFGLFQTMFGVNFADGRIKGYPLSVNMQGISETTFYVYYVRGNPAYGANLFSVGEGTITDRASGLMWSQADSGAGMDWLSAMAWMATKNAENYLGHNDWRLPTIKELQSILDYTRSPATTYSAAINPVFQATKITNEAGQTDWAYYWSSTPHLSNGGPPGNPEMAYFSFGRAMGKILGMWMDVHGAGAQRSDPPSGDATQFNEGKGPQGDAIRIDNFVRLVRTSQEGK